MNYDYVLGKERIEKILNNNIAISEKKLPKDDSQFTYDNGINCYIGSIFVDIVKSSEIIQEEAPINVSKILRSFTSEIICIMNSSDNIREIGVRGDCVYGIYATPYKQSIYELADIAFNINTFIAMLNKLLSKINFKNIQVGIGVAFGKDLVVKAGQKGTGINDRIWIGNAVVVASNLANVAGRNGKKSIAFSNVTYDNFIDLFKKNSSKNPQEINSWFKYDFVYEAYFCSLVKAKFNNWVSRL